MLREPDRRSALEAAEARAMALFDAIERADLIRPGRGEDEVERDIHALADRQFGITKHWHKRIVRAGANTLTIASDNPPIRTIDAQDVVYVDLGPVFELWEADIGRSYALGDDPVKKSLVSDLPRVFQHVQAHYRMAEGITGADLFRYAQSAAEDFGWQFGGVIAGHIVSEFAHAQIPGDKALNRIGPANTHPMRDSDALGRERHWILEIHLVDRAGMFGGFYERLL
jgi:Xaa-Pro aminopeptidase